MNYSGEKKRYFCEENNNAVHFKAHVIVQDALLEAQQTVH